MFIITYLSFEERIYYNWHISPIGFRRTKKLTYLKQFNCLHRANVSYQPVSGQLLEASDRQIGNFLCRSLNETVWRMQSSIDDCEHCEKYRFEFGLASVCAQRLVGMKHCIELIFRYEERIKHLFKRITNLYSFESQEICIHLKFIIKWMQKNIQIEKLSFYSPQEYSNKKIAFFLWRNLNRKINFSFSGDKFMKKIYFSPSIIIRTRNRAVVVEFASKFQYGYGKLS